MCVYGPYAVLHHTYIAKVRGAAWLPTGCLPLLIFHSADYLIERSILLFFLNLHFRIYFFL